MRPIDADVLLEKAWDADTRIGYVQVVDVGDILDAPTVELEQKGGKEMDDLISRQAAIEAIERNAYRHTYLDQIINIISNLPSAEVTLCHLDSPCEYQNADIAIPSAQPERKKGRWVHDGQQHRCGVDWMHCSECGYRDAIEAKSMYYYCPNCGADMRGEEDDSD